MEGLEGDGRMSYRAAMQAKAFFTGKTNNQLITEY